MAEEKDYYTDLTKYYIAEGLRIKQSITWEAKISKTHRINFKVLVPHQEEKLLQSERCDGFKIPDVGRAKKNYDGCAIYNAYAVFVAIYFLSRRTEIYEIPIRSFLNEKYTSKEKSLTKKRASEIGTLIHI